MTERHIEQTYFKPLGRHDGKYHFFVFATGKVIAFKTLSRHALLQLAPLSFWEEYFPKSKPRLKSDGRRKVSRRVSRNQRRRKASWGECHAHF